MSRAHPRLASACGGAAGAFTERMRPFAVDRFERNQPVVEPGIVLSHFE
ncbi:hypothetical protein [Pseudomonas fluorescens]|nr:hypothetical protein [Pseudomonas fluorescens]